MVRSHKRETGFDQVIVAMLPIFLSFLMGLPSQPQAKDSKKHQEVSLKLNEILSRADGKKNYDPEFKEILSLGDAAIPDLAKIFKDTSKSWQIRWICAMALGEFGGDTAWKTLQKGMNDSLFLVRLASLKAAQRNTGLKATKAIEEKLSDKALVVRSSAVNIPAERGSVDSIELLSKELFEKRNFHRGKSLWIRKNIVQAFGQLKSKKALPALETVLQESESDMRETACDALKEIEPEAILEKKSNCWESWMAWYNFKENPDNKAHTL